MGVLMGIIHYIRNQVRDKDEKSGTKGKLTRYIEFDRYKIYEELHVNNRIAIKNGFIRNFSLTEYRKIFKIPPKTKLSFESIQFIECYLHNKENGLDITDIEIKEELSFSNSILEGKVKDFSRLILLKDSTCIYDRIDFGNGNVVFNECRLFESSKLVLRNTLIGRGNFQLRYCLLDGGYISINNLEHKSGVMVLNNNKLKNAKFSLNSIKSFSKSIKLCNLNANDSIIQISNFYLNNSHFIMKNNRFKLSKVNVFKCIFKETDFDILNSSFRDCEKVISSLKFKNSDMRVKECKFGKLTNDMKCNSFNNGKFIIEKTSFDFAKIDMSSTQMKHSEMLLNKLDLGQSDLILKKSLFQYATLSIRDVILNNYTDLRLNYCHDLKLIDTVNNGYIDMRMKKNLFKSILFEEFYNNGTIEIDWSILDLKNKIYSQNTSFECKAKQFVVLKENYNLLGKYDYEDEAYYEYKKCMRKNSWYQFNEDVNNYTYTGFVRWLVYQFWHFLRYLLFDFMGGYGTKPKNVFYTMITTIFTFGLIYSSRFIELRNIVDNQIVERFKPLLIFGVRIPDKTLTSFYHSVVTFLTIGYGDIKPPTMAAVIISGIEGFIGLFLMSYFTVAFARKILR